MPDNIFCSPVGRATGPGKVTKCDEGRQGNRYECDDRPPQPHCASAQPFMCVLFLFFLFHGVNYVATPVGQYRLSWDQQQCSCLQESIMGLNAPEHHLLKSKFISIPCMCLPWVTSSLSVIHISVNCELYPLLRVEKTTGVSFTALNILQSTELLVAQLHDVVVMQSLFTTTWYVLDFFAFRWSWVTSKYITWAEPHDLNHWESHCMTYVLKSTLLLVSLMPGSDYTKSAQFWPDCIAPDQRRELWTVW